MFNDLKRIYNALTKREREALGIGNAQGPYDFGPQSTCRDCDGPMCFESGWGYSCVNNCYKLGHILREAASKNKYNRYR